jgi:hypothetical protein
VVLERIESKKQRRRWQCQCDCGDETNVPTHALKSGNTKSCGCLNREMTPVRRRLFDEARMTHGMTRSPTWSSWRGVVTRFLVPATTATRIEVDLRWVTSYEAFLTDMGEKKPGQQLERIDPDGAYTKTNCRWSER